MSFTYNQSVLCPKLCGNSLMCYRVSVIFPNTQTFTRDHYRFTQIGVLLAMCSRCGWHIGTGQEARYEYILQYLRNYPRFNINLPHQQVQYVEPNWICRFTSFRGLEPNLCIPAVSQQLHYVWLTTRID